MRINVAQQLKEPVGEIRHHQIDARNEQGLPIRGQVQLLRTNGGILVAGELKTVVKATCSRCLEEFECRLNLNMEEEYPTSQQAGDQPPLFGDEDGEGFIIDDSHVLDLGEAIRQHTLLALPIKPICQQNCAGLCPSCGQNLNYGRCRCAPGHGE